jgi:hypothetical protein
VVEVQALNDQDTVTQKNVCKDILKTLVDSDINHVLMMDDTNFHLCGHVSIQDCLYWTTANTRDIIRNLYVLRRLLFGVV